MEENRIKILLNKYHRGECSEVEIQELRLWYEHLGEDRPFPFSENINNSKEHYIEERYNLLLGKINETEQQSSRNWRWQKLAASIVICIGLATGAYYLFGSSFEGKKASASAFYKSTDGTTGAQNRFLKLPDSSIVILHAGSSIELYDSTFKGKTREVSLTGTAYFDIHHLNNKPFIIHSGSLKVTVLGTAFSIKNDGDSISVTVTRGKVKVENERKQITYLTSDQQAVYQPSVHKLNKENVKSEQVVEWIRSGLTFNDESFDSIARKLEGRFGVKFHFNNEMVKQCRVSAAIPFTGTESLNEILSLLCPVVNGSYSYLSNGDVLINGPGCE